MTTRRKLGWALAAGLIWLAGGAAAAGTARLGRLTISNAWIRATPNGATTAAAYLTVTNDGAIPDRLIAAASRGVASITPHAMSMAGGVMRMRELTGGITIPAHSTVTLAPGGDHLMLMGLKRAFRPGETMPMRLKFARGGTLVVDFEVRSAAPIFRSSRAGEHP